MLEQDDDGLDGPLNVTSEEVDFEGIDEDLASFQEDEMVKQALQRGVDLRKYADELEKELRDVRVLCLVLLRLLGWCDVIDD